MIYIIFTKFAYGRLDSGVERVETRTACYGVHLARLVHCARMESSERGQDAHWAERGDPGCQLLFVRS